MHKWIRGYAKQLGQHRLHVVRSDNSRLLVMDYRFSWGLGNMVCSTLHVGVVGIRFHAGLVHVERSRRYRVNELPGFKHWSSSRESGTLTTQPPHPTHTHTHTHRPSKIICYYVFITSAYY